MRRQANGGSDVRLEINNADSQEELLNDIVGSQNNILGSQSDIDDSQNSEIDLLDEEDTEEFLSQQPLVQSKTILYNLFLKSIRSCSEVKVLQCGCL